MGSDSDFSDEASDSGSNPREFIPPEILKELTDFDLSGHVAFKERRVLNGGAYGDISKDRCTIPGRGKITVAIKRIRFYLREDMKMLFEKEIYVWSKLDHHNILPLLGFAFDDTHYPLLVSEWMDNGSAWNYVKSSPECDILNLITGIAEGLTYLHKNGVVHSDIKSDNILVSKTGKALICDFGCARMIAASRSLACLSTGQKGTSRYLACEVLVMEGDTLVYSPKSDVWAFGMTVYELLTLHRPYQHLNDAQVYAAIMRFELPSFPNVISHNTSIPYKSIRALYYSICQPCWSRMPTERTDMPSILKKLQLAKTRNIDTLEESNGSIPDLIKLKPPISSKKGHLPYRIALNNFLQASGQVESVSFNVRSVEGSDADGKANVEWYAECEINGQCMGKSAGRKKIEALDRASEQALKAIAPDFYKERMAMG